MIPTYRCWVDERSTMQTRSVIRRSGGFAVEEARLELMIAPAMTDTPERQPSLPLEEPLAGSVRGVTDLVNRFLVEAGLRPIVLSFDGAGKGTGTDSPSAVTESEA